jgi:hypothetical protein
MCPNLPTSHTVPDSQAGFSIARYFLSACLRCISAFSDSGANFPNTFVYGENGAPQAAPSDRDVARLEMGSFTATVVPFTEELICRVPPS